MVALPTANDVIERLRVATGSESDAQLARNLDVPQTTVSGWRNRQVLPYEACAKVAIDKSISLDKLIFGEDRLASDPELLRKCVENAFATHRVFAIEGPKEFSRLVFEQYKYFYNIIYSPDQCSVQLAKRNEVLASIGNWNDFAVHFAAERSKPDAD